MIFHKLSCHLSQYWFPPYLLCYIIDAIDTWCSVKSILDCDLIIIILYVVIVHNEGHLLA